MKVYMCKGEDESWDIMWKWSWHTRKRWMPDYWRRTMEGLSPLFDVLPNLDIKSMLDASCGLGVKTIIFSSKGYRVDGSDSSAVAIEYAPQLAKEHGVDIRFFQSRFEELGRRTKYRYDCVFSDYFDELGTYDDLIASARGVYDVLNDRGKFIFCSPSPGLKKGDLERMIEDEWRKRKRVMVEGPIDIYGAKLVHIEVIEKTYNGILENRIYIITEGDNASVEVAYMMNPRIMWTYDDFVSILKEVGFRSIDFIEKEDKEVFIIATK